jgi:hypothetical protein
MASKAFTRVEANGNKKPKPTKIISDHRASPPYFETTGGKAMNPERQSKPIAITAMASNEYQTRSRDDAGA